MLSGDHSQNCERYRNLVESSPDAVVLSRDGVVEFLNPAALRLLGTSECDRFLGKPFGELFHPSSQAAIRAQSDRLQSADRCSPIEVKVLRIDGSERDVEVSAARLAPPDETAVQLTVRDVTDRKQAMVAVHENEERLTLAFGGAQEGVWDWNLGTGGVVYSSRWKEMLGYADDEIGPHVRSWEELLHPGDKQKAQALYEDVLRGVRRYEAEFRLRHKKGHYIVVLTRGLAIRDDAGRVVRIVGTHLDITHQKQTELALRDSEERLRLAFEGAQEGVWDWNLETDAVVYSPRWKQMLGYADDEIEPHVSAWERLVHPDDRSRAAEADEKVSRGEHTYQAEFRLRHKDGHYVHVLSRGFPIRRDPGGPVIRIVGTHFDLTERKKTEAERARTELLQRLVFAQEDERRRIARDMHDQFGEQLTALSLQIGRLKTVVAGGGDVRGAIDALDAIARHLDDDVDELIWQLRPTALDDLGLRAALSNYLHAWSERTHIAAQLHDSGLQQQRLRSEVETTLYRIAQEALNNIAKHAAAKHVEIVLERRGDAVILMVEDDGRGFDPAETSGGGFGLVSMRERAALVGANLEIESAPGQGTTVLVRVADPSTRNRTEEHA